MTRDEDFGQQFADCLISALICGATTEVAAKWVVHQLMPGGKPIYDQGREYQPRHDPAFATPRLPEREWWPLRNWILERDGYRCTYCGDEDASLCADHVVPLSRGGSNHESNLVCACIPCNSSKSDRLLSEWKGRYQ